MLELMRLSSWMRLNIVFQVLNLAACRFLMLARLIAEIKKQAA